LYLYPIQMEIIKINMFPFSDILIRMLLFILYFFFVYSSIEDHCKVRLLLVMSSLLELKQDIKDTIKIEYARNNDEIVTSYRLFVFFSMYVKFRDSP
jgi:hypothetical protein